MPKEFLSTSMPKLILAVVLIVCVGAVMGLMGWALTKKQTRVEVPEVEAPAEIVENETSDWQTYRNEEFGFSVIFDEEYKNIWESKTTSYADGNILARTDFYFKDYPLHIFSSINIYKKEWFIENSEKRVQYKEWSAENNGTIEEYNKIRDEMKSEFIREKGEIAWLKGDSDGYPLGTYLEENNDYVFVLGIGPNGCMATELLCSLPIREMTMDSFQVIDTDNDWQTYRNEEFGFEVKYPEDFLLEQVPQPKTEVMQCDYVNFLNNCSTEITIINDVSFCLQKTDKAAAGTRHTTYSYTTVRNQECFIISFTVAYPSCSNYLPIQSQEIQKVYDKCRLDNEVTKPKIINQIFSSFKFIEK